VLIGSGETVCFKRLVFPKHMMHRFGLNYDSAQLTFAEEEFKSKNETVTLKDKAFATLRRDISTSFNMPSLLTPHEMSNHNLLVYDRRDASRRVWSNCDESLQLLTNTLNFDISYYGVSWKNLTLEEQFAIYYKSKVFVLPHGGHLGNLLATRPGSIIFEISCNQRQSEISLNAVHQDRFDSHKWDGSSWFTGFSRRQGNHHFILKGKCAGANSDSFTFDAQNLLRFMTDRMTKIQSIG